MKNKLKWYHYVAKVILIGIFLIAFPVIALITLSSGSSPLAAYKEIWYDNDNDYE